MENRTLLESGIPVDLINREARKEKYAGPPIVSLHKYATRKPLITSRMVVAGALLGSEDVPKSYSFYKLLGIDSDLKKRAYIDIPQNLIHKISSVHSEGVTIFDPFAGTGMIPFEALRMGVNVVASDYNPVAYLIMKGTLEYPIKYNQIDEKTQKFILYEDVKKYSNHIFNKLKENLEEYYPKHNGIKPRTYIHCWAVKCPTCGNITPLVNNWILDSRNKINVGYEIENKEIIFYIYKGKVTQEGNVRRGKGTCLFCSSEIKNKDVVNDIQDNEREILLAIHLKNGEFVLPLKEDFDALEKAKDYLKNNISSYSKYIPIEFIADDSRAIPTKKYLRYWYKLFNSRQLLVMVSLTKYIREIVDEISEENKDYALAVGTYLSMILSRQLMLNSRSANWQNSRTTVMHILSFRGINMIWDHPEPNPFIKTSGSLINNMLDVLGGLKFALLKLNNISLQKRVKPYIEVYNESILSWNMENKFDYIITDPPYYDDVPYPEIFQYFQVWHNKTIGHLLNIPSIPSTNEELSVNQNRSKETFENRMLIAIKRLHKLLYDDGVLVMFYVHKSIEGWKYVIEALKKSGFVVTSTISLMTESEGSVLARGKSSIFHSLVITARKRIEDRKSSILDVEEEIRNKMEERYHDLERLYGKDRTNLLVAASGIVIETITKYSEVTSFTRNTADYALEMGQRYLIEVFAKNNLNLDNVDSKTMIYTWFRHSLIDEIDYSEFNQTLKALGTSEESISDIIYKEKGKGNKVRLLDFSERGALEIDGMEPLIAASLIDAMHIALRAYMRGGITAAKEKIDYSTFGSNTILNTIEALGRLHATKTGYSEGEVCARFIEDWNAQQSKPRKLTDWAERTENERERR